MLSGLVGEVIHSAMTRSQAHKNFDENTAELIVNASFGKLFKLPTE